MAQIGDYVVARRGHHYGVRMAGAEEYLSTHETEKEARAAVARYQAGDKRRAKAERDLDYCCKLVGM